MIWTQRKTSKFNAKRTTYNDRTYDSKLEATVAAELDMQLKVGEYTKIEPQYKFELRVNGKLICTHKVDFLCHKPDGSLQIVEAKGYATRDWAMRRNLLQALYPEIEYEVRTARNSWLGRKFRGRR